MEGDALAHRPDVDHRVESLEGTFAGEDVILPAAAYVLDRSQVIAIHQQAIRLGRGLAHQIAIEESADDDEPLALILSARPGIERWRWGGGCCHSWFSGDGSALTGSGTSHAATAKPTATTARFWTTGAYDP